ncbi:MAG: type secretion system ATPase [Ramlibacter sp.]|nr:type secretion system ATPase [Ramlibacter sp.]
MKKPDPKLAGNKSSELRDAFGPLRPYFVKSAWFTVIAGLLVLMPSWYMLEVYDRVVNSRSVMTLLMLTVLVLAAYVVMEVLEWAHNEQMREAGLELDRVISDRIFTASFEANLSKRLWRWCSLCSSSRSARCWATQPWLGR